MPRHDVIIIGGGIVGLATAWRLLEQTPTLKVIVLEKEPRWPSIRRATIRGYCTRGSIIAPARCEPRTAAKVGRRWSISAARRGFLTMSAAR